MQYEFEKSFVRDYRKVKEKALAKAILEAINTVSEAGSIKDYRIGLKIEKETVYFVDIDHRKNIYRIFPK
ncbi:MAG: hypothetical protein U5L09_09150 [Bacteroidales bacterium]|nr:hypothetical protein [Bacteroidales bacterium]